MPTPVNKKKDNIFNVQMPYHLLARGGGQKNEVIFWGADFKYLPPDIPENKFISLSNACLDFVRRNCRDCKLIYKLHPAETDEYKKLDLSGFEIVGVGNIGEFYLLQNISRIKYTFSAISGACVSAHKMGIPSFVFLALFEPLFTPATKRGYREYFSHLPEGSFVSDLNGGFQDYDATAIPDKTLEDNMRKLLKNNSGRALFIADTPGSLAEIIAQANLIKTISSGYKTGLIVCRHHRWDVMNFDDLKPYFDSIDIFPRTFYSLRPGKLMEAIRVARAIKKFTVKPEDILIGSTHTSFVEVCFMSFHKKAKRLCFLNQVSFDMSYGPKSEDMLAKIAYKTPPASIFYNLILEPLLGLYRTIYMDDPGKVMNFRSYQKPINDIYDQVYLI